MRASATIAFLLVLALAPPAFAQGHVGGKGKRGAVTVWRGTCKYGVFGPRGVLQVGLPAPRVGGANTRRRTRRERTYVRYRVAVTDAFANHAPLARSSWSGWIRLRQSQRGTWSGPTIFDMDWRGNYGTDVRVEWWNSRRRVGRRTFRTKSFNFYDQYNVGPFGPISSCYKYTSY